MPMDLNARAAYIRGLMHGMEFDPNTPNGKVIAAMMDLLEEMAAAVTSHSDALDQVNEELELLDGDLDELVGALYGDEEEDGAPEEEETLYEVTCPNCNTVTTVDEQTLLEEELVCPNCGAAFDIELEPEEEGETFFPAPPTTQDKT